MSTSFLYKDFQWEIIFKLLSNETLTYVSNKNIDNVDEKLVNTILTKNYMDNNSLDVLKRMFNSIFFHHIQHKEEELKIPYLDNSIVKILNTLRLASKHESSEGYALFSNFKTIKDMVVLKTSKDMVVLKTSKKNFDNLIILYEYFIGSNGINTLRNLVPNFTYTLGIFKCNPLSFKNPTEKYQNLIVNMNKFCSSEKNNTFYVMYERIDGISLEKYIKNMSSHKEANMLISYLIQISLALQIAQTSINFTHYDLHTENIILRRLPEITVIEYIVNDKIYRVETDAIPTIIDYGFAYFTYKGIPFGMVDRLPYLGISSTTPSKGYDMYKLLCFVLYSAFFSDYKNHMFDSISWLIEYFKESDIYGIYKAYKNLNKYRQKKLYKAFGLGHSSFFCITQKDKLYHIEPIEFVNLVQQKKLDIYKQFVRYTNNDKLFIDDIFKKYNAMIEGKKIFKENNIVNSCDTSTIIDRKSYIINNYIINELNGLIRRFNISNDQLVDKLKSLKKINEKNKIKYKNVDKLMIDEFNIVLNELLFIIRPDENILDEIKEINDIRKLEKKMKIIEKYISIFDNFRVFSDYSKFNTKYSLNNHEENYELDKEYINIEKKFYTSYYSLKNQYIEFSRKKTEFIFNTMSIYMNKINNVIYNVNSGNFIKPKQWIINEDFYKAIRIVQYILEDIVIFYPHVIYACTSIQNFISKIIYTLNTNHSVCLYVSQFSNTQIKQAFYCEPNRVVSIIKKLCDYDRDQVRNFLQNYIEQKKTDTEIYKDFVKYVFSWDKILKKENLETINASKICISVLYIPVKSYMNLELEETTISNDFSKMLEFTISGNKNLDINNVIFSDNTINSISIYKDDSIDFVTAFQFFHSIISINFLLSELNRIIKRNGFILIKEKDMNDEYQQLIIDIETKLLNVIKEKDDLKINIFCKPRNEWDKILKKYGFKHVNHYYDPSENPTMNFYTLYQKM